MTTILQSLFVVLLAMFFVLLSLAVLNKAQTLVASVGWHRLVSVSWNG